MKNLIVVYEQGNASHLCLDVHEAGAQYGDSALSLTIHFQGDQLTYTSEHWAIVDPEWIGSHPHIPFSCLRKDVQELILNLF